MPIHERRKDALIEHLRDIEVLHDDRIERAFRLVPLEEFIPEDVQNYDALYLDQPQVFYFKSTVNLRTISAPHMVCIMLEYLNLQPNDQLLMLGSKSGYIAAIASTLCSEGHVYVVESSEEVLELTRENLASTGFNEHITLLHGNPLTMAGTENLGPWDKILVPYQVQEQDLFPAMRRMANEGVLFAPIGDERMQFFTQVIKHDGKYFGNRITTVNFSPLDQNVTFLSQQVMFLELIKTIGKNLPEGMPRSLESDLVNARSDLEKRVQQENDNPVNILYNSPNGDALHDAYRDRTFVNRRETGPDFKIIEDIAVEIALKHHGRARVVTIGNSINLPFDVIVHFLKSSTRGHLVGALDDTRSLKYELNKELMDIDPVTIQMFKELQEHLPVIDDRLERGDMAEFKELLRYILEKLEYVDRVRQISFKGTCFAIQYMISLADQYDAALKDPGRGRSADRVKRDIEAGLVELRRAVKSF